MACPSLFFSLFFHLFFTSPHLWPLIHFAPFTVFPEMKTALRSYHPVPSLQKTDGNLQDAPRIKNCLKAALLPFEARGSPPSTPHAILENAVSQMTLSHASPLSPLTCTHHQHLSLGCRPATNDKCRKPDLCPVIIFYGMLPFPLSAPSAFHPTVSFFSAQLLGPMHFEPPLDFMDLFLPHPLSSASRARAFLWLIFNYYQGPQAPNPFADEYAQKNQGKMPRIQRLTEEEMSMENIDMPEEIEWAKRKSNQRSVILRDLIETEELEKRAKGRLPAAPSGPKGKTLPVPRGPTFWHLFHCLLYLGSSSMRITSC